MLRITSFLVPLGFHLFFSIAAFRASMAFAVFSPTTSVSMPCADLFRSTIVSIHIAVGHHEPGLNADEAPTTGMSRLPSSSMVLA